jgi:hypothetical protein
MFFGLERRDAVAANTVIASGAKQSILSFRGAMDCFAPLAMTRMQYRDYPAELNDARGNGFPRPGTYRVAPR